ncbi:MAG: methionyl-tRNA formyltransferase, partial [Parvibaculales bacterium]
MTTLPRIIFMGTAEFSIPPLRALHGAGFEIAAVYTKPPRHSGRGQHEHRSPIHREADNLGLPVFTAPKLFVPEVGEHIESLSVDIGVVIAYGLLIPKNILGMPSFGFLNIHASLLPRWRGAAPIQRAIMAGDTESGVSIIEMDEGLDTGAVLLEKACPIFENETFSHL